MSDITKLAPEGYFDKKPKYIEVNCEHLTKDIKMQVPEIRWTLNNLCYGYPTIFDLKKEIERLEILENDNVR